MPRVLIVVKPDGTALMKVEGVSGPACLATTKKLEESLGLVTNRKKTPEMDQETARDRVRA